MEGQVDNFVGQPVVLTYTDSQRAGYGTILTNAREYFGHVVSVRESPCVESKAKGFVSPKLVTINTNHGYRQFYDGRIVKIRKAGLIDKIKAKVGLY